jgi:ubiquinone/menaquinone biosynthesis C-methylase UbiE
MSTEAKQAVHDFWERASCGEEAYARGGSSRERLEAHARTRYELEPHIRQFARFESGRGLDVLEVGVGMGADHLEWARHMPRSLSGIDLTERGIAHTATRLALYGLRSDLRVADAENLPFPDASFDLVYSWGVLHVSPDTPRAVREVLRVLRPGGVARVMIYHAHSMVGYMLWLRYALLAGRPRRSLADVYAHHLESPGTKAYSQAEARSMFSEFSRVDIRTMLHFGDLLEGAVGQRHRGPVLSLAKRLYPRAVIRRLLPTHGLTMLIEATR